MQKFIKKVILNFIGLIIVSLIINLIMHGGHLDMGMWQSTMYWLIGLVITIVGAFLEKA